jgi:hypothetical protein
MLRLSFLKQCYTVNSHGVESLQFSTGTLALIQIASRTPSLDSLPWRACNVVRNLNIHILGNKRPATDLAANYYFSVGSQYSAGRGSVVRWAYAGRERELVLLVVFRCVVGGCFVCAG